MPKSKSVFSESSSKYNITQELTLFGPRQFRGHLLTLVGFYARGLECLNQKISVAKVVRRAHNSGIENIQTPFGVGGTHSPKRASRLRGLEYPNKEESSVTIVGPKTHEWTPV